MDKPAPSARTHLESIYGQRYSYSNLWFIANVVGWGCRVNTGNSGTLYRRGNIDVERSCGDMDNERRNTLESQFGVQLTWHTNTPPQPTSALMRYNQVRRKRHIYAPLHVDTQANGQPRRAYGRFKHLDESISLFGPGGKERLTPRPRLHPSEF